MTYPKLFESSLFAVLSVFLGIFLSGRQMINSGSNKYSVQAATYKMKVYFVLLLGPFRNIDTIFSHLVYSFH